MSDDSNVLFLVPAPGQPEEAKSQQPEDEGLRLEMVEYHGFRIYDGDELVCDRSMDYPTHKEARKFARQQLNWLRKHHKRDKRS